MPAYRYLILAAACLAAGAATAQTLYRWTDAQGRTHLSDRPPPADARNVRQAEMPMDQPTPEAREEALRRAAQDKARAAELGATPPAAAASGAAAEAGAARPRGGTSCEQKWAAYHASQACYAPYRTATGGLLPDALAKCGPGVPDPSAECPLR